MASIGCPPDWWYEPDEYPEDKLWEKFAEWMGDDEVNEIFLHELPDVTDDEISGMLERYGEDAFCDVLNNADSDDSDWGLFRSFLYAVATPEHLDDYRKDDSKS